MSECALFMASLGAWYWFRSRLSLSSSKEGDGHTLHADETKALKALANIQAKFRGDRSRTVHVRRAKEGKAMICPFLASTPRVVDDILALVGPMDASDVVYDLGSGDGPLLIGIAQATGARCIGVRLCMRCVKL
jgi:methylase of polypeptide subunit release factors